ncbi:hypothetical protein L873DRAFT_1940141 [Choiromyces venosus 120613-1]|uniref:Uncharacterized protein n=1 Tax=Choiromyces venosus 120613-1 TaxID=1336337 RepID=A0A3N4J791_9PEZI|nr:hypothetical protein L873DRAFT_1940141 [Choiromyces venosus 120613-1]
MHILLSKRVHWEELFGALLMVQSGVLLTLPIISVLVIIVESRNSASNTMILSL